MKKLDCLVLRMTCCDRPLVVICNYSWMNLLGVHNPTQWLGVTASQQQRTLSKAASNSEKFTPASFSSSLDMAMRRRQWRPQNKTEKNLTCITQSDIHWYILPILPWTRGDKGRQIKPTKKLNFALNQIQYFLLIPSKHIARMANFFSGIE